MSERPSLLPCINMSFLSSSSPCRLSSDNKASFEAAIQLEEETTYAFQSGPSPPFPYSPPRSFPFPFHLSSRALGKRLSTQQLLFLLVCSLCNCGSSTHFPSQHLRGGRTIQNTDTHRSHAHVYKTALLIVKGATTISSIVFESGCLPPVLLACFPPPSATVS